MKKIYALYGDIHHDDEVIRHCLQTAFGSRIVLSNDPNDIPWDHMAQEVDLYISMKETNTTPGPDGALIQWITPEREQALYRFVFRGGAALFVHNGLVGYPVESLYHQISGGVFIQHPPLMKTAYVPARHGHPIVQGVERFVGEDEKYFCHIDVSQVDIFLYGDDPRHPGSVAGWCKTIGEGRTVALTPGHTLETACNPNMTLLLKNAAAWAKGGER